MERETRFELATATLATWGSTTELLPQRARLLTVPDQVSSIEATAMQPER